MSTFTPNSDAVNPRPSSSDEAQALSRLEDRLSPLLSVIAGMVDLTGFLTLGNIFTAHVTGNLVLVAAVTVRGGPANLASVLAIPVFISALAVVWLVARASRRPALPLAQLLLVVQLLLLTGVWIFSVIAKPSASPHGLMAGIAAMIAVSAMACQYALFRLAMPHAVSTAVMTGNLTNTVLSLMDALSPSHALMTAVADRSRISLHLLIGFLIGCMVAAAAVSMIGDWAWSFPVALGAVSIILARRCSES
jgi:uncharacterized membrane protein YoaK (UPF0700 family)